MSIEIKVPQLPESITEATLVNWHKKPGEAVQRDENLVDIETDKVVLEVPAPDDGVLKEIKAEDGETVSAEQVIGILEAGEAAASPASQEGGGEASATEDETAKAQEITDAEKAPETKTEEPTESAASAKSMPLAPSVKRLVEENDLDPGKIPATGRDGRLTKADVLKYLEQDRKEAEPAHSPEPAPSRAVAHRGAREERRVRMSRLRARVAERMTESQTTTAMLTSFNEIDMTEVMAIRSQYKEKFEKEYGVRLGFMSFFVKAAIKALKMYPVVNASIEDEEIVYHDYWDIGVAVSTDRGLMVPVLRDADQMSFAEVESTLIDMATRARSGKIGIEELTGGTFTITNGGVFGSLFSTPIINPPQSAILGMHKIQQRPMVVDGEIKARPMMYIALTYDHRLIDGREAVLTLVAIKEALEDPARLLIDL